MKKAKAGAMKKEYDFSKGIRGKYARRFAEGNNVVVLDPDLAERFRGSDVVNRVLRSLVELADRSAKHSP